MNLSARKKRGGGTWARRGSIRLHPWSALQPQRCWRRALFTTLGFFVAIGAAYGAGRIIVEVGLGNTFQYLLSLSAPQ